MSQIHQAFLPQHTAGTHRVFAVANRGDGEVLEALATFPTAERADTIADLLNLLVTGRPAESVSKRLSAALDGEPAPVRAAVLEVAATFDRGPDLLLAGHLQRRLTAGFASFSTGCPSSGCERCDDCSNGCTNCAVCETVDCEACYLPAVTPRTALLLHAAADILSDELTVLYDDEEDLEEWPAMFPHLSTDALNKFADTFLDLGSDLAEGRDPHPRSTAEEIALHLMTERANVELEVGSFDGMLEKLPPSRSDYDWPHLLDVLYQDTDYVGLMDQRTKLPAKAVADLFERFDNMGPRSDSEL